MLYYSNELLENGLSKYQIQKKLQAKNYLKFQGVSILMKNCQMIYL